MRRHLGCNRGDSRQAETQSELQLWAEGEFWPNGGPGKHCPRSRPSTYAHGPPFADVAALKESSVGLTAVRDEIWQRRAYSTSCEIFNESPCAGPVMRLTIYPSSVAVRVAEAFDNNINTRWSRPQAFNAVRYRNGTQHFKRPLTR